MSKFVLGIDLETTGFSKTNDGITEIGAVLWDIDRKQPVQILSKLVKTAVPVSDKITEITGITQNDVDEFGEPLDDVLSELTKISEKAVACVAHNAPFDRGFLESNGWGVKLPWIDTMRDIDYPAQVKYREQTYIAAHAGFINPFSHRAITDVLSMLRMVEFFGGFEKVLDKLDQPVIMVQALVSFENKDKAKKAGFSWDRSKKRWVKEGRLSQEDLEKFDFPTKILKG